MVGSIKRMSLQQFMHHKPRASGGGNFLMSWSSKKNAKPSAKGLVAQIDVLMNAAAGITAAWQHPWHRNVSMERTENGQQVTKWEIWGDQINCLEDEDVLVRQYFYNDKGEREAPPKVCPMCLLIEYIGMKIERGELDWLAPVFRFAPPGVEAVTLYAGGITGQFGSKNLTEADKSAMKEATKITPRTAYTQNAMASLKYIFCVADVAALQKGVQVTTESKSLGQRVQEMIEHEIAGSNEAGNPFIHPYVVRWEKWPDADPKEQYKAYPIRSIPITPEMRALVDMPPPDGYKKATEFPNMKTLRAKLEAIALVKLPWDEIFAPVMEHCDEHGNIVIEGEEAQAPERDDFPPQPSQVQGPVQPGLVQSDIEMAPCDRCRQPFPTSEVKCPHCGKEYEVEEVDTAPAPAVAAVAPAPAPVAAPAPPPPPVSLSAVGPGTPLPAPNLPQPPATGGRRRRAQW